LALILDGTNTPTLGGIGYGDGTELAFTGAGSAGGVLYSAGGAAPVFSAAGTAGQVLTSGGAGAPTWVNAVGITLGTPVASTSGATIDFTGIPAGTKMVMVMLKGVSVSSAEKVQFQLGDSGGIETTGYEGAGYGLNGTATPTATGSTSTTSFQEGIGHASWLRTGTITFTLYNAATYTWVCNAAYTGPPSTYWANFISGSKSLTGELDRVRILVSGATFDAGEINIAYI